MSNDLSKLIQKKEVEIKLGEEQESFIFKEPNVRIMIEIDNTIPGGLAGLETLDKMEDMTKLFYILGKRTKDWNKRFKNWEEFADFISLEDFNKLGELMLKLFGTEEESGIDVAEVDTNTFPE
jgi:hypothetical protein